MSEDTLVSIIRNINNLCPYHCDICLVNAKHIKLENHDTNNPNYWINKWLEISLEDKIKIINNLNYENIEIDVSWGEPLLFPEWLEILNKLSNKFWRERISLTTTWASNINFDIKNIAILEHCVWNIDFTYDWVGDFTYRPSNYNQNNLSFVNKFSRSVKKTAQIVLTTKNLSLSNIEKTVIELKNHNIDDLFLIKFHPIWRWIKYPELVTSIELAKQAIDEYIFFSEKYNGPKIKYQKTLLGWKIGAIKGCSFFINEIWDLFSNSWKKDKFWKDDVSYKIGNLVKDPFTKLCWTEYINIKNVQNKYNKI